jgi:hypothetical protein
MRMGDAARIPRLGEETAARVRIVGDGLGEKLQRDGLPQPEIVGPVDLTHTAPAELGDDAIAIGEHRPRRKPARRGGMRGRVDAGFRIRGIHVGPQWDRVDWPGNAADCTPVRRAACFERSAG